ncbi:hypothetical protein KXD40_007104 [Peronospora effusa]|uniref:Uncharacterized protein n=1 Tax=Peronospora effusa TaxID=542832 RepID=A0A3M6VCU2_9STRA|nr:hypothetical protein DD238_004119 [Peronospora effusa]RQM15461.1 hypothetical protein DD237_003469 [Peronospora effusa]UIZ25015.1 hypothetical protein KXD40_007104 [Peronospora effusa]
MRYTRPHSAWSPKTSFISVADSELVHRDNEEAKTAEYTGNDLLNTFALRITIVVLIILAI